MRLDLFGEAVFDSLKVQFFRVVRYYCGAVVKLRLDEEKCWFEVLSKEVETFFEIKCFAVYLFGFSYHYCYQFIVVYTLVS